MSRPGGALAGNNIPLLASAVAAFSFAVYFNTLWNGFVYDDTFQVLGNRWITDVKYIPKIFANRVWGFKGSGTSNYYRPLMHVFYMLEYHVFGLKPWCFHLVNILLHAGVSVLVFLSCLRLTLKPGTDAPGRNVLFSCAGAMLFAAHPVHTEAVAWVASLPELTFTLFYLLSFYLYATHAAGRGYGRLLPVISFLLAAFCKETALTLPIMLIVYDYAFGSLPSGPRGWLKRYGPYILAAAFYLALRHNALGAFAPVMRHRELGAYGYIINIFPLFGQYAGKLLLPADLNLFHVLHPVSSITDARFMLSAASFAAFAALTVLAARYDKAVLMGLAFLVVPLLPTLYIPGVGENTLAERYLYLPSFGFVLLVSAASSRLFLQSKKAAALFLALCLAAVCLYSAATFKRNGVWHDNYTLWADTVAKSPDGAIPHEALGYTLVGKGLVDEAIGHYQAALRLDPAFAGAHVNLGIAYYRKGLKDKALEEIVAALKIQPDFPEAHNALGIWNEGRGNHGVAIEEFLTAVRQKPDYAEGYNNLGIAYAKSGMPAEAARAFETAVALNPAEPRYMDNLAKAKAMVEG